MKRVTIKSIEMHYFKGIKNKLVTFGPETTEYRGRNGSGKSTIVDAFHWCLWGKNAQGDQKFSVKTLDENGVEIPYVDHEVETVLDIDGTDQTFKRVLVPEYDRNDELKGNHTDYYWNNVPMKKSEYDQKVNEVIKESVFKLITSPYTFLQLDWQKQRETLMRMAGDIKDEEVHGEEFDTLKAILRTKSLEEHIKEIQAKLKKVNEAMQNIPARIDEVQRGMPELPEAAELNAEKERLQKEIEQMQLAITNSKAQAKERREERDRLGNQIAELINIQCKILQHAYSEERKAVNERNETYNNLEQQRFELNKEVEKLDYYNQKKREDIVYKVQKLATERQDIEKELEELRNNWRTVSCKNYESEEYLKCPLYGHLCQDGQACSKYDQDQTGAYDRWQQQKDQELDSINQRGQSLKKRVEENIAEIKKLEEELVVITSEYDKQKLDFNDRLNELERALFNNPPIPLNDNQPRVKGKDIPEYMEIEKEIVDLQSKYDGMAEPKEVNEELNKILLAYTVKNEELKELLTKEERVNEANKRIEELMTEQRDLGNQKTILELKRETARAFEVAKMTLITDKVNSMFKLVKWQMWARQVNGEEVPACICTYKGVPWSDVNEAQRLDAGIDVAYTLSEACKVSAPMFIDGAEKSLNIYNAGGQRILLRVAETDLTSTTTNL